MERGLACPLPFFCTILGLGQIPGIDGHATALRVLCSRRGSFMDYGCLMVPGWFQVTLWSPCLLALTHTGE